MDTRSYAIGDIHGHPEKLARAHALIAEDRARCGDAAAPVIHLGDLTDRGPDSRRVLDMLIDGIAGDAPWTVLLGNHDRLFRNFLDDPDWQDPGLRPDLGWLDPRLGGDTTLESYGLAPVAGRDPYEVHREAVARVPRAHREFLAELPLWHERGAALFVHAGIRPGVPMQEQSEDDLVWIRNGWLEDGRDHGRLVVHGHTALERPRHFGNRVDLDGGAAYGRPLVPAVIEDRAVWLLTEDGRVPLRPEPEA
ncbi:metallophosphoesterase [Limimaricola pyoseonensis]|uniref:Serine/threonine protein phosphatase 1 n=1 Tax=Limimaricola pyoseonensis TaxID=521013 RepID=A0A1G7JEB1_9RHOB|nr:metallophosphoesterase [Limimaricola pyoseonensis]SDF23282.1 serine/threonine protein phosphatase 1 [Limimaricola pyoseonensis]